MSRVTAPPANGVGKVMVVVAVVVVVVVVVVVQYDTNPRCLLYSHTSIKNRCPL